MLSLKGHNLDQNLILGAGSSITEATEIFKTVSLEDGFRYLNKFVEHLGLVASIPVKNVNIHTCFVYICILSMNTYCTLVYIGNIHRYSYCLPYDLHDL